MRTFGLHLMPSLPLVGTPRPSALVELDHSGSVTEIGLYAEIDAIVAAIGRAPAVVACDAPLVVANATGKRDLEHLLQWCDVPLFPVSLRRLETVYGGHRGGELLRSRPGDVAFVETPPDLVLRQFMWDEVRTPESIDLADYRERWIGLRPPVYRPKGSGRARPAGIDAVWGLVGRHVDLGGWAPHRGPDDWQAIADAATLDAVCCAWVAYLSRAEPERVVRVGADVPGQPVLLVDDNLRERLIINAERLSRDGIIQSAIESLR